MNMLQFILIRTSVDRLYSFAIGLLFCGYFGIKLFFDGIFTLPDGANRTLSLAFATMIIFAYISGAGGNAVSMVIGVTLVRSSWPHALS
jgi:hypothetical protein